MSRYILGSDKIVLSFKDISSYFGISEEVVNTVLGKQTKVPGYISQERLWTLIVFASNANEDFIEDALNRWKKSQGIRIRKQITPKVRKTVMERDKNKCRYCGKRVDVNSSVLDHIIPVSRGGTNEIDNLVQSCRKCNYLKGSNHLLETNMTLLPPPQ